MIIYLCSCGFSTDDPGWFDAHLDEHPGHSQRRMVRDSPGQPPPDNRVSATSCRRSDGAAARIIASGNTRSDP
jgi:hypothetical protein